MNDIRHPNIVEITDFGQFSSYYCIVMELLEGETLAARLQRTRTLDEATAVRIFRQVTSALGAAHEQGMVHRDVKPENIFLRNHPDYPDFVKVLDFGIAKLMGGNSLVGHHTKTGTVIGTPAYMSPEQCLGEASLDLRSDIYSLGVVLYEALTGRQPFVGDTLGRLIVCHVSETPIPPSNVNPHVSGGMSAVVMRALAKQSKDRFASMKEFREALEIAPVRAPAVNVVNGRHRSITRPVPMDPRSAPPASPPPPALTRGPGPAAGARPSGGRPSEEQRHRRHRRGRYRAGAGGQAGEPGARAFRHRTRRAARAARGHRALPRAAAAVEPGLHRGREDHQPGAAPALAGHAPGEQRRVSQPDAGDHAGHGDRAPRYRRDARRAGRVRGARRARGAAAHAREGGAAPDLAAIDRRRASSPATCASCYRASPTPLTPISPASCTTSASRWSARC